MDNKKEKLVVLTSPKRKKGFRLSALEGSKWVPFVHKLLYGTLVLLVAALIRYNYWGGDRSQFEDIAVTRIEYADGVAYVHGHRGRDSFWSFNLLPEKHQVPLIRSDDTSYFMLVLEGNKSESSAQTEYIDLSIELEGTLDKAPLVEILDEPNVVNYIGQSNNRFSYTIWRGGTSAIKNALPFKVSWGPKVPGMKEANPLDF